MFVTTASGNASRSHLSFERFIEKTILFPEMGCKVIIPVRPSSKSLLAKATS
jgi:hypothetical protein